MFMVVSEWEPLPGKEQEFMERGMAVGSMLRQQPGVEFMEGFKADGKVITVVGYTDEATYHRLIDDPNGVFAKEQVTRGVEEYGRWLGSQRGETLDFG